MTAKELKRVEGVSDRIRTLIFESGDSLKGFADAVGVYPSYVHKWINGGACPTARYLCAICRYYGVTSDWLLGLDDERGW
jgi:transcriptional regulator with XRE-family HTH domain